MVKSLVNFYIVIINNSFLHFVTSCRDKQLLVYHDTNIAESSIHNNIKFESLIDKLKLKSSEETPEEREFAAYY